MDQLRHFEEAPLEPLYLFQSRSVDHSPAAQLALHWSGVWDARAFYWFPLLFIRVHCSVVKSHDALVLSFTLETPIIGCGKFELFC